MTLSLMEAYESVINEHRQWLKNYGNQRSKKWEDLLSAQPEAAICEAATRKMLVAQVNHIEPNEDPSSGGPDFRCIQNGDYFYVEATCITQDAVTEKTNLEPMPKDSKTRSFGLLTQSIFGEICKKTPQCSGLNAPCLVAIGTLHSSASQLCFGKLSAEELLTGETYLTCTINTQTSEVVDELYEATYLQSATFIRPARNSSGLIEYARNPISAILLCPFGYANPNVIGVLHPNPNHEFDKSLLPEIEFCRLAEGYQEGQISVKWI